MSETKASHSHKMWTASSSAPYFLQVRLLLSLIICKYFLKVLCPVRRPITTLNCVLLKDSNWALVARSGPEINSRTYLCVLQRTRHNTRCWFSIQPFIFPLIFSLETPKKGSDPTNRWTEPSLASLSAISFLALRHAQRHNTAPQFAGKGQGNTPVSFAWQFLCE
jgi:hypothetical protein